MVTKTGHNPSRCHLCHKRQVNAVTQSMSYHPIRMRAVAVLFFLGGLLEFTRTGSIGVRDVYYSQQDGFDGWFHIYVDSKRVGQEV